MSAWTSLRRRQHDASGRKKERRKGGYQDINKFNYYKKLPVAFSTALVGYVVPMLIFHHERWFPLHLKCSDRRKRERKRKTLT